MNHSLLSKVVKTVRKIQKTNTDPLENYAKIMTNKNCKFQLKTITMADMQKTIHNMKNSRSAGTDGISIQIIIKK